MTKELPNRFFTSEQLEVVLDLVKRNVQMTAFIADAAEFPRYDLDEVLDDVLHIIQKFAEDKLESSEGDLKSVAVNIACVCIMGLVQDYAKFVDEQVQEAA